ncbi:hypothetical protein [Malikia sp.]|uniref:hypothetical protein n=1 Tax=Malikia sp. TaxID=2070706 RepID=UPI00261CD048|nr:hypothetical protein [Malikia sp.]MDD2728373.1 hypothetical protein [Malikia sp.]
MNSSYATQQPALDYLQGLSELIQGQLEAACADVAQTGQLLDEAVDQLNLSFNALGEGLSRHETADVPSLTPHVHQAITGLQFHDLTNQLLKRITLRLEGLRAVIAAEPTLLKGGGTADWQQALLALSAQQTVIELPLQGALRQQTLDSGDIELF